MHRVAELADALLLRLVPRLVLLLGLGEAGQQVRDLHLEDLEGALDAVEAVGLEDDLGLVAHDDGVDAVDQRVDAALLARPRDVVLVQPLPVEEGEVLQARVLEENAGLLQVFHREDIQRVLHLRDAVVNRLGVLDDGLLAGLGEGALAQTAGLLGGERQARVVERDVVRPQPELGALGVDGAVDLGAGARGDVVGQVVLGLRDVHGEDEAVRLELDAGADVAQLVRADVPPAVAEEEPDHVAVLDLLGRHLLVVLGGAEAGAVHQGAVDLLERGGVHVAAHALDEDEEGLLVREVLLLLRGAPLPALRETDEAVDSLHGEALVGILAQDLEQRRQVAHRDARQPDPRVRRALEASGQGFRAPLKGLVDRVAPQLFLEGLPDVAVEDVVGNGRGVRGRVDGALGRRGCPGWCSGAGSRRGVSMRSCVMDSARARRSSSVEAVVAATMASAVGGLKVCVTPSFTRVSFASGP